VDAQNRYRLLTSPGPAAIAVIELRGRGIADWARRHLRSPRPGPQRPEPQRWRAELLDHEGSPIDDVIVCTLEGSLQLHLHGSPAVVRLACDLLESAGFEPDIAKPSQVWPTDDPLEAAAIDLLPEMSTGAGVEWVFANLARLQALRDATPPPDWPRLIDELATRPCVADWYRRSLRVALVGPPNAGKSTLANALADQQVSLVSPIAGTTRDWVEVPGELDGFPVTWLDTPGLRSDADPLEAAAIELAALRVAHADARVLLLDARDPAAARRFLAATSPAIDVTCYVANKCDSSDAQPAAIRTALPGSISFVEISADRRTGLSDLAAALLRGVGREPRWLHEATWFPGLVSP
jgi:tRNA modification GTPase